MKKALLLFIVFSCSVLLFSCKRSDVFGGIEPNTNRVLAEFTHAATGTLVALDFSAGTMEVDLTELRLSTRTITDHRTRVKVIANPIVVSDYNAANGTSYVAAGAAAFSLTNEYVLGPEERKVMVKASLRPSAFLDQSYAIGLSIAEMSDGDISPIAKHVIVFVSIKNEYDGIYQLKGYSEVPGSTFTGHFSLPCSEELEVATSGGNSVYLSPSQPAYSSGGFTYIANVLPDIALDKTTNKVTAVTARAGGLGLIFPYDPAYNSRYDPATKTMYVKYGVEPVGSGRFIIDTLLFCKPR
ncbi:MAG TPA: DUF1735 domain-containing protein [Flavisolibacter sp.]|jgi:hypothetical protein